MYEDLSQANSITLRELLQQYRDDVSSTKKGFEEEKYKINKLCKNTIASFKLTKDDVDYVKRTAILRNTKNGEDRVITLTEEAITVLKEQPLTTSGHFFQASNDKFKHYWNKAKLIAGAENFR